MGDSYKKPNYKKLLDDLLKTVELHHLEWYDIYQDTIPAEPQDIALWKEAERLREVVGYLSESDNQKNIQAEILRVVNSSSTPVSPTVFEAYFPYFEQKEVKKAIISLAQEGFIELSLDWNLVFNSPDRQ